MGSAAAGLSSAATAVWAKYDEPTQHWLPLYQHMADSVEVAQRLWDDWLPDSVRRSVAACLPEGMDDGRALAGWLAGCHDVGKASPPFAGRVQLLTGRISEAGLPWPLVIPRPSAAPHGSVSQIAFTQWLLRTHGFSGHSAHAFGCVLGGHHGVTPTPADLRVIEHDEILMGREPWQHVREELLNGIARSTGALGRLADWRNVTVPRPAQALLTAVVIVADWIASNQDYFPLLGFADRVRSQRAELGWKSLGLPPCWEPTRPPSDTELHLRQRFPFLESARPLQRAVLAEAWGMDGPGVMVVEAPMGAGKTEAALAAAEVLAYRFGAGGVFVALPLSVSLM